MIKNRLIAKLEKNANIKKPATPSTVSDSSRERHWEKYPADPDFKIRPGVMNPMCTAAMPLIGLAIRLSTLDEHEDIEELQRRVRNAIINAVEEVRQYPYEPSDITFYSYTLCQYLDETVLLTKWGNHSYWSHNPLLSQFHDDVQGGKKFFVILSRIKNHPERYLDLLEFMYTVLCMGLKGEYGIVSNGERALQAHIEELHKIIREQRGPLPDQLCDPLANIAPKDFRMPRIWPWWSPLLIAGIALVATYAWFSYRLQGITAEVLQSLRGISL